ncbi:MAG TPA: TVP38/TMEM64 family protein [Nitrospiraceae bacterium]|jgi:uncharacterized membrane protein YdjX (TVP38/TMEM64 family)|nr:TVP38/TMEM64 family protein [Nitrospiraceae bacterium]
MTDSKAGAAKTSVALWSPGRVIIAVLLAAAIGAFFYFDIHHYLSLESLKANRDRLLAFAEERYTTAVVIFVVSYCLFVATNLPGAVFFTLAGGMLFGAVLGTVYVNIAATSGSTLAFLASRYLLHDWVERKFGGWLGPFQEGFKQNAFTYLLTIRLIPIFPFFIVNVLCGLTRISLGTFVAATAIGIIPGTFVYAYAGQQLGRINSLQEIASPRVLLAFTLLGLLALAPLLYRRFTVKRSRT